MSRASEELLSQLHNAIAADLLKLIQTGEASSADRNAAIKLLKDNDITYIPEQGDSTSILADDEEEEEYLPFQVIEGLKALTS